MASDDDAFFRSDVRHSAGEHRTRDGLFAGYGFPVYGFAPSRLSHGNCSVCSISGGVPVAGENSPKNGADAAAVDFDVARGADAICPPPQDFGATNSPLP